MKEIAQRIKQLRVAKGMSQQELADKMGYRSRSAISKIEQDTYDISIDTAKALAVALEVDPDYIVFGETDQRSSSIEEINRLFDQLDDSQQDAVLAFLRSMIAKRK